MAMLTSESKFEIELRAKTKIVSLRVRVKGALWGSPVRKSHRVSDSICARVRALILGMSVNLFQVLGSGQPQQQRVEVRYSLRIRLRKLWLRVRGKHQQGRPQGTPVAKPLENPTPVRKNWRHSLSSVGKQLLLRGKGAEKITMKEPVKENGYVAQHLGALGTDRVVRVVHGVGMVSTLIVLVQLSGTRGLPLLITFLTELAIVGRLVFFNRYAFLESGFQQLWYEAMSVGGVSLLLQVLRAVFRPYLRQAGNMASESVLGAFTLIPIILARYQRLPFKAMRLFGFLSVGVPAILVFWASMLQLVRPLLCMCFESLLGKSARRT